MKVEMKKANISDGENIYKFLCDIGIGENGFIMTPPKNEDDFKKLLNKYEMDSSLNQAPGRVSQEVFWMYIDDIIVGIIKIRAELNENLLINGGNMGYSISPNYRGKGYGKLIVKKGLEILKSKGVNKVLVTIYENNIPSRKSVEGNNGILEDISNNLCRYWISNY
ncbi:MAG: GNAT family N-acetyltransferase [Cetobacterium sp.]|uniref:GNAT family N-acetyltransferase n=1 Tax=Cetobacterium sp. TaxID=2071632 RepID=UPI003F380A25